MPFDITGARKKNSEKSTRLFYIKLLNTSETAFFKKKLFVEKRSEESILFQFYSKVP